MFHGRIWVFSPLAVVAALALPASGQLGSTKPLPPELFANG